MFTISFLCFFNRHTRIMYWFNHTHIKVVKLQPHNANKFLNYRTGFCLLEMSTRKYSTMSLFCFSILLNIRRGGEGAAFWYPSMVYIKFWKSTGRNNRGKKKLDDIELTKRRFHWSKITNQQRRMGMNRWYLLNAVSVESRSWLIADNLGINEHA